MSVSDSVAVEPVDSWRPDASIYESGEILCLASPSCPPLPVPQPGHSAGKAEPNEPPQSKEKFVEGLEPVIWGLQLLEDLFIYLFHSDRCGAVQEMCSCNCCVEICVFLNFRLQCKRNH